MEWLLVLVLGVAAGTLGGVVGFGASVTMMPILAMMFGPKDAVPIMAIAGIMANASRVAVWWREVDWRVNAAYCATAVPAAALGARLLLTLDTRVVEGVLGLFLLGMIPVRRWLLVLGLRVGLGGMAAVGAGIGLLSGLVATTGPVNTPFFLAYGLVKGAYIATEAVGSVAVSLTKAVTFRSFGALPLGTVVKGLVIGTSLMLGSWLAKRVIVHMDGEQFRIVLEAMMLVAGTMMLWSALAANV